MNTVSDAGSTHPPPITAAPSGGPGVVLTGAHGFLGWHTRVALREAGVLTRVLPLGAPFDVARAAETLSGADRIVHLAGVNRGTDGDIAEGNVLLARQVSDALSRCEHPPPLVVFANSVQSGNGSVYGEAKARAAEALTVAADNVGARFENVRLPNLFGEHGRAHYNSVTATFCHQLAHGGEPVVHHDRELVLLHAQNAAELLIGNLSAAAASAREVVSSVGALLDELRGMAAAYRGGEIPDIRLPFQRDLFNTYRSSAFGPEAPFVLDRRTDARGSFVEVVRTHGGSGQHSFSTTVPGASRGDHYHRRKVERFTVLSGTATISLRRLFFDQVLEFAVSGENPMSIDMPTMWAHKITNTGQDVLFTSFWANEPFNAQQPDTSAEAVQS
ncbi:NAD-dependent epimerase/dehydratase family protein [Cryobacterium sp. CG_9.6]|uniref:polysaccharide biosynthesis C-terminal domain-containing protein n=1 Tax=Cryobacterium sp. CG_9.6 TaxID=2760710 RepID=UPI002475C4A6|nr:NAD-dependent epimerase/dehydratase family protein [Cryobacterium sp. CG_9.6]MDH6235805.1 UDP-2-acetamido-2,6-beta-L-arabino-hexul-4-ose reductase [Cryobacterium sp. CG_9.6]